MRKFFFVSLFLHALFCLAFLIQIKSHSQKDWSGGLGQWEGVVTVMLRGGGENQELGVRGQQSVGAIHELPLPNSDSSRGGQRPATSDNSQSAGGQGSSPTPAGGKGEGYDFSSTSGEPDVLQKIRQRILSVKEYPLQARRRGLEGTVGLAFRILADGGVGEIRVISSSGTPLLDDEAVATIKRGSPYPYYPSEISLALKFDLKE